MKVFGIEGTIEEFKQLASLAEWKKLLNAEDIKKRINVKNIHYYHKQKLLSGDYLPQFVVEVIVQKYTEDKCALFVDDKSMMLMYKGVISTTEICQSSRRTTDHSPPRTIITSITDNDISDSYLRDVFVKIEFLLYMLSREKYSWDDGELSVRIEYVKKTRKITNKVKKLLHSIRKARNIFSHTVTLAKNIQYRKGTIGDGTFQQDAKTVVSALIELWKTKQCEQIPFNVEKKLQLYLKFIAMN